MRWSLVLLLAIGGFGACLGAALSHQKQDPKQPTDGQFQVRIQPAIDQQKTIPLEAKKLPSYFG